MHSLTLGLLAIHMATCLTFDFVLKFVRKQFHKLMNKVMDVLGINALFESISRTERTLKLLAAISLFVFVFLFGVYVPIRRS